MTESNQHVAIATLAGGCFWCLEAVYERMQGVQSVVSGYMGGTWPDPTYADVCTGQSGHAEVVRITFDPRVIDFAGLLRVFFTIHDPTTLNRQGNDHGTQYRSAIFYHDAQQLEVARQIMAEVRTQLPRPIVTELTPAATFYPAEPEHQHYFAQHPAQSYCQYVVAPKVAKFEQHFPQWIQPRA
jgi:peptide-methionine (S)-S-oxide reductase